MVGLGIYCSDGHMASETETCKMDTRTCKSIVQNSTSSLHVVMRHVAIMCARSAVHTNNIKHIP